MALVLLAVGTQSSVALEGAGDRRAAARPSRRSVNHLTHRCRRSAEAAGCGDDADRDRGSGRTGAYERRPMQS